MAGGSGRRSGADRVLESRHLVGLFLGVVLLCGVFFTLGYVMGKTQYGGAVHASESITKTPLGERGPDASPDSASDSPDVAPGRSAHPSSSTPPTTDKPAGSAPSASEWDFYTQKKSEHLETAAPKSSSPAPVISPAISARSVDTAPKAVQTAARYQAPHLVKGSIVLQIAALTRQGDALAMADELQQKKFPAFVVTPAADNFYRVQVGPYADEHAADTAKAALDRAGFKAITKR
jgi:DedD protein